MLVSQDPHWGWQVKILPAFWLLYENFLSFPNMSL